MGLGVSLLLIAVGAILIWGLQSDVAGISEDAIGVILIVGGMVGFIAIAFLMGYTAIIADLGSH